MSLSDTFASSEAAFELYYPQILRARVKTRAFLLSLVSQSMARGAIIR